MSLLFDQNLSRHLPGLLAAELPGSVQVRVADVKAFLADPTTAVLELP